MEIAAAPTQSLEILETPQELARALRTTPQTVNKWHRDKLIPARIAVGRIVRFNRAEVLEALALRSREVQTEAVAGAAR